MCLNASGDVIKDELVRRAVRSGGGGDDDRDIARDLAEDAEDRADVRAFGFASAENFHEKFPDFAGRALFIAGESYEGLEAENLAAVEAFYAQFPDFAGRSLVVAGEGDADGAAASDAQAEAAIASLFAALDGAVARGTEAPPPTEAGVSDDQ